MESPVFVSEVFGPLAALRARPIPDQTEARARYRGYRQLPIATATPEPLTEIATRGIAGANYYHVRRNPPYWRRIEGAVSSLYLRASVAEKLAAINARTASQGLELFVFDAWRPRAVQAYFHDVWMPAELQRRDPALSGAALTAAVERYWAAPTNDPASPAPHATGAAVDLSLRWKDGTQLWMGSIFDDVTTLAHRDRFEQATPGVPSYSDEEACANRRLLHWLMCEEGFAGHPDEWWHFSFGDQLWAALTGGRAWFGPTEPISEPISGSS
ncbi:MAG: peptidase M15D vanX D-ala-D-ala dipeptidase [Alphaproteobacteria bacterium]|nr:peptidase M15D vanX D-ala-D-ala dipeptidase [Alphaproteobacteria bacterium]MDE2011994.1 peptidase M15D vanX D-ala-D-ala dipeptidase [Alphaproteobacteria bacterium]MDE2074102.1 peptidase M15D vanX D-ala-D-ala dipeptidase [Alphaproteobacteria bacterium]MDE2350350.1 peptidase M15D vanX D-ala-D-ala dipeptidase [Alphaproteobacteria bacterium]